MSKYKLGLVNMLMAAVSGDGGAAAISSLVAVGDTVADSAKMETTEASTTDFNIEESDSPVLSIKSAADKIVISWSTYNNNADTLVKFFGGTKVASGTGAAKTMVLDTAGSGYTDGAYEDVPVTGGAGTGLTADITVVSGAVTAAVIRKPGKNYAAGATALSVSNTNLGGAGTGLVLKLSAVEAFGESWQAPDAIPEIEKTLVVDMKEGGKVIVARAKIIAKLSMNYKKTALSQIDITATVLQPTKSGEPRMVIQDAIAS